MDRNEKHITSAWNPGTTKPALDQIWKKTSDKVVSDVFWFLNLMMPGMSGMSGMSGMALSVECLGMSWFGHRFCLRQPSKTPDS